MLSCVDTGHKPQLDSFLSLYFLRSSFSHHSPCSLQRYQRILSECVLGRSGTRRGYSLKIFCASSLWKGKKGTEKLNWKSSSSSFFRPLDTDCGDEEKKRAKYSFQKRRQLDVTVFIGISGPASSSVAARAEANKKSSFYVQWKALSFSLVCDTWQIKWISSLMEVWRWPSEWLDGFGLWGGLAVNWDICECLFGRNILVYKYVRKLFSIEFLVAQKIWHLVCPIFFSIEFFWVFL